MYFDWSLRHLIYNYVYIYIYIFICSWFSEFLDIHQASSAALRFYQIHAMLLTYLSQAKFRLRCMVFSAYIHHPEVDRRWRVHRYSPFITFRCIHIYIYVFFSRMIVTTNFMCETFIYIYIGVYNIHIYVYFHMRRSILGTWLERLGA